MQNFAISATLTDTFHTQWFISLQKQDVTLQSALWDVASGTRVGVMLDYAQRLHLYVDGRHVTMVLDLPTTCFAMFDLRKRYRMVCYLVDI